MNTYILHINTTRIDSSSMRVNDERAYMYADQIA